jgi:hypothetical protein
MKRIVVLSCLVFVWSTAITRASLYEQSVDPALAGQYSNAGLVEAADSFALGADGTVTAATWFGFYEHTDLASGTANIDFSVAFFANAGSVPGTELWRQTLSAAVTDTGLTVTKPGAYSDRRSTPSTPASDR